MAAAADVIVRGVVYAGCRAYEAISDSIAWYEGEIGRLERRAHERDGERIAQLEGEVRRRLRAQLVQLQGHRMHGLVALQAAMLHQGRQMIETCRALLQHQPHAQPAPRGGVQHGEVLIPEGDRLD